MKSAKTFGLGSQPGPLNYEVSQDLDCDASEELDYGVSQELDDGVSQELDYGVRQELSIMESARIWFIESAWMGLWNRAESASVSQPTSGLWSVMNQTILLCLHSQD
jgi:hypothetical protein